MKTILSSLKTTARIGLVLCAASLLAQSRVAAAFDGGATFQTRCAGCHSIGAGKMVGPDLKDITKRRKEDWLIKFIQSSTQLIASGDAEAKKIYEEFGKIDMPEHNFTDQEVRELLKFIDGGGVATTTAKSAVDATPADIEAGRRLYLGLTPLAKGGPSCVSCHSVGEHGPLGGGTLAKDLSSAYTKFKDAGLTGALKSIAFPVMQDVFAGKELSDDEIFQLKAFLYQADKTGPSNVDPLKKFVFLGLSGTAVTLGVIDFTWRRRRKSSVRRSEGGIR